MATDRQLIERLNSADPIPTGGRQLVRYLGGREAAVRTLTGQAHAPRRGDYRGRNGAERYEADRKAWRAALQRVRRWDTEARGAKRTPPLTTTERRRVQAANRRAKAARLARVGLVVRLHGVIDWGSPGANEADQRVRTIPLGGPGQLLNRRESAAVLAAARVSAAEGVAEAFRQADAALGLYAEGFQTGHDSYVRVWPADEAEPAQPW